MTRNSGTTHVWMGTVAAIAMLTSVVTVRTQEERAPRTAAEFDAMFREINNWRRWGASDELGTMNLVTEQKIRDAVALVRRGVVPLSLERPPLQRHRVPRPADDRFLDTHPGQVIELPGAVTDPLSRHTEEIQKRELQVCQGRVLRIDEMTAAFERAATAADE